MKKKSDGFVSKVLPNEAQKRLNGSANRGDRTHTRINIQLSGECASWLIQWKQSGLVTSNRDAVVQAFRTFHERLVELKIKEAQLENLQKRSADE